MLRLTAFVPTDRVGPVCDGLARVAGIRHVAAGAATMDGLITVSADVDAVNADVAIDALDRFGLGADDVTLWRVPDVQPLGWRDRGRRPDPDTHVWAEVVGRAHQNSALAWTYLVYMVAAGVIAGIGVITGSAVLVVGAMAISPDLLPISATAIGIVERRWRLVARAGRALTVGLATGAAASLAVTALMRLFGRVPDDLVLADTVMGEALTHIGPGTLMVAAAAGVAGIVAFERSAGAAVGVAISVTTIPAAAYIGAAIAMGRDDPMVGALGVLVTNVVTLIAASSVTLMFERRRRRKVMLVPAVSSDGATG